MIRASVKRLVRAIYAMRCGYCQLSEAEIGAELTYDHFQPQAQGGSDDADNLVYACHACNEFKGDYYGVTAATRLLHPLRDDLTLHLRQDVDGTLKEITPAGRLYIEILHLNRPPLVLYRLNRQTAERSAARYEAIETRLDQIMTRIQNIEDQLRSRSS